MKEYTESEVRWGIKEAVRSHLKCETIISIPPGGVLDPGAGHVVDIDATIAAMDARIIMDVQARLKRPLSGPTFEQIRRRVLDGVDGPSSSPSDQKFREQAWDAIRDLVDHVALCRAEYAKLAEERMRAKYKGDWITFRPPWYLRLWRRIFPWKLVGRVDHNLDGASVDFKFPDRLPPGMPKSTIGMRRGGYSPPPVDKVERPPATQAPPARKSPLLRHHIYGRFWTDDGGATWHRAPDAELTVSESPPGGQDEIHIFGYFWTDDGGQTWHPLGLP